MEERVETVIASLRPQVLATARRFCRATGQALDPEDIAQDVLIRYWLAEKNGASILDPQAWAARVTRNCCVSLWRKARKERTVSLLEADRPGGEKGFRGGGTAGLYAGGDASTRIESYEAARLSAEVMETIPESTRKLLGLRAAGLSLDEMAAVTGRPKDSIKSSISAARRRWLDSFGLKR